MKNKILILILTYKEYYRFLPEVLEAVKNLNIPEGFEAKCLVVDNVGFECNDDGPKNGLGWTEERVIMMAKKRNFCLELAKDYDWLLSIDGDILVPHDALINLLASEKKCISGWTENKKEGGRIVTPDKVDYGEIFEIQLIGTYCLLEHKDIFLKVKYREEVAPAEDRKRWGDIRMAGFKIYCHPDVHCEHLI